MKTVLGALVGFAVVAGNVVACSPPTDEANADESAEDVSDTLPSVQTADACSGGRFHCYSKVVVPPHALAAKAHSTPDGLGAKDLASAYKLDTTVDPHATIAIVDAFGYAKAEADLKMYRAQYGLPPCTIANGCLMIVNQDGNTSPLPPNPPSNDDWTEETALDLDMASAACPKCKILLAQSNNDQDDGLFIAQGTAARLGATVISNSWGQSETTQEPSAQYEHYFENLGNVGVFVASGDSGYNDGGEGPDYPSTSAHVTAVGGTRLTKSTASARGWKEVAWSGTKTTGASGSSCAISIAKPTWQGSTACNQRAASDVSAVGDPNSGPAIYNNGSWSVIGGTSAACPLVAGIFALTGHGADGPRFSYDNPTDFFDVTSGTNGTCGNKLCKASAGWDGLTGNGSPNGAALKTH
jgi:hypothetical protein